jgi:hypothetical protein
MCATAYIYSDVKCVFECKYTINVDEDGETLGKVFTVLRLYLTICFNRPKVIYCNAPLKHY